VVEVVTDDMSFLIGSVTNELSWQGRGIQVVIHPQVVRRDATGRFIGILRTPLAGTTPAHDARTESWIHVEVDHHRVVGAGG